MQQRSIWKTRFIAIGAGVAISFGLAGCDNDEFADAPTVSASDSDQGESGQDYHAQEPGQGEAPGSPGPVQGQERPEGHPTFEQGEGGQQGGQPGGSGEMALEAPAPEVDRPEPDQYGEYGPITWDAPESWQPLPPENPMRFAQYNVPDADGDRIGEVTVFFFGPGGGGGVTDNLDRWASQLVDGDEPERDEIEVDGMTVHTLDASGTYQTDMAMGAADGPIEDQRLLGAIADTHEGLFFFRFLGDHDGVSERVDEFDAFVESFQEGG